MYQDYKTTPRPGKGVSIKSMLIVNLVATSLLFSTFVLYLYAERLNKQNAEQIASSEIIISCHQDDAPELAEMTPHARAIEYH